MPERSKIVEVILRAKDQTSRVLSAFEQRWRAVTRTLNSGVRFLKDITRQFAYFAAGVTATVLGLKKLADQGDKVNAVKASFAKITGDEVAALDQLRRASAGTISDLELMSFHNQALALGAADTTEQFAELIDISRKLGRAQGIDASRALESLTTGLGRQSKMFLDNLGILIDVEKVYQQYAASVGKTVDALTDQERRTAFITAAMDQARQKAAALSAATGVGSEAAARFGTAFANAKDRLAEFVAQSPLVAGFFDQLTNFTDAVAAAIQAQDWDALADLFKTVGRILGNGLVLGIREALQNGLENLGVPGFQLSRFLGRNNDELRANIGANITALDSIVRALQAGRQQRGAAGAGAGGGMGAVGVPGLDVLSVSNLPYRALPSSLSPEGIAEYQRRQDRIRMRPVSVRPVSPLQRGASPEVQAQIDADTVADAAGKFDDAANIATAAFFGMAEAAVAGSDRVASSVISMITSILQSLPGVGGLLGTVIGGVGGLFAAAVGRNSRPVPVSVSDYSSRALEQQRQLNDGQPIRITTITEIGGQVVDKVERELLRRTRSDGVVRYSLGRPLGAP